MAVVIAVMAAVLIIGTTIAYKSREATAENVITSGNVTVELLLTEKTSDGMEKESADALNVIPGTSSSRIARVKNIGASPAWVRVKADVSFTLDPEFEQEGTPDPGMVIFENTNGKWTYSEGYWYYNEVLQPGETTATLFEEVKFSPEMGNLYQNAKAAITVDVFAAQSAHNGNTALEAAGWPE